MEWARELQLQLGIWQSTLERKSDIHLHHEVGKLANIMGDLHTIKVSSMDGSNAQQVFERLFEHFQQVDRYILSSKKKLSLPLYKYCTNQVIHKKLVLFEEEFAQKMEEQQMLKNRMDTIERYFVHSFHDIEEANSFVEAIVKHHSFYYEQFTLFEAWKQLLYKPYKNLQTFSVELREQMEELTAEYTNITQAWDSLSAKDFQKKALVSDFASRQENYNVASEKLKDSFDVYLSMQALQKEYFEGYFTVVREYLLEYYHSLVEETRDLEESWSGKLSKMKKELFRIPHVNLLGISNLEKFMNNFKVTIGSFYMNSYEELEGIPSYQKTKTLVGELASSLSVPSTKEYFEAKNKVKQIENERKRVFISYHLSDRKLCTKSLFGINEQFLRVGIFGIDSRLQKLTLMSKDLEGNMS